MSDFKSQSKAEAALFYTSLGWALLPLHNIMQGKCSCGISDCRSPGKHPRLAHGVKEASNDPEQVKTWWEQWPDANIGIAAGNASGILLLDVDGEEGIEVIKKKEVSLIDETLPVIKTGSGKGYHFYFKPFLDETPNGVRIAPGLDIRGDNGYGILPPSDHISGEKYEWVTSPEATMPEAPQWLKQLITQEKAGTGKTIVSEAIPEGQRNDTLMSIAGTLRRRNLSYDEILAALNKVNQNRCFPPLDDREVRQIATSVSKYNPVTQKEELDAHLEAHQPRIKLKHITEIENPLYLNKKIEVEAIVSSTSYAYAVPKVVKATWIDENGGRHSATQKISITNPINMNIVGISTSGKRTALASLFPEANKPRFTDEEYRTVYTLRVRPPIFSLEEKGGKLIDDKGFEYKNYRIYVVSDRHIAFPASSLMILRGSPLPDPKNQQITLLVSEIEFPDSIGNYDVEKINELVELFAPLPFETRIKWVLDNFEEYSRIVGRRNIATATFLGVFSPIKMTINGETQRGWANILILGDTTSAKTKTVTEVLRLVDTGTIITAETASTVGLTGAAVQIGKEGWSVDWGFLVLNDMGILAVDGAHKLSKSNWAALAEAERKGIVTISKAAKDTAYSRTRQIKIANPVDPESNRRETKNLDEFYYPAIATGTFLDLMSIARLDLCVFSDSSDVKAEEINKKFSGIYDERLHNLAEVRKWVWSTTPAIQFTPEAEDALLSQATELYNKFFYKKIPLASIDLKWKLGIMSASLAALTLSIKNYDTIIIEKEHIDWVRSFIEVEYTKVGLHTLAERSRHETATEESVTLILEDICNILTLDHTQKAKEVLEWIAIQGRYVKEDLKEKFALAEKAQLRPLNSYLSTQGLVRRGNGFYATTKLNRVCKVLATIAMFAIPREGTPLEEKETPPTQQPLVGENLKGGIFSGGGEPGNRGKITGTPRSLQLQLQAVLGVIGEMERIEGAVRDDDLYETLSEELSIDRNEATKLIGVLMRDGTIYCPRPGYYRRTT